MKLIGPSLKNRKLIGPNRHFSRHKYVEYKRYLWYLFHRMQYRRFLFIAPQLPEWPDSLTPCEVGSSSPLNQCLPNSLHGYGDRTLRLSNPFGLSFLGFGFWDEAMKAIPNTLKIKEMLKILISSLSSQPNGQMVIPLGINAEWNRQNLVSASLFALVIAPPVLLSSPACAKSSPYPEVLSDSTCLPSNCRCCRLHRAAKSSQHLINRKNFPKSLLQRGCLAHGGESEGQSSKDAVGSSCRSKVCEIAFPTHAEMSDWKQAFYYGAAFPALARILIYDVAKSWLADFSLSTKKQIYDSFFVKGPPIEIVQVLVPALTHAYDDAIYSNIERLLVRCLLKSEGIRLMVGEFRAQCQDGEHELGPSLLEVISRVAQLLTSIPDKARLQSSSVLSSHLFFQQVVIQLFMGAEDCDFGKLNKRDALDANILDGSLLFIGESFTRICRRGSADILIAQMIPRVLDHVHGCLSSSSTIGSISHSILESSPKSQFWLFLMEAMKDQYAVERMTEELLRQLATRNVSDVEVYWTLWLLFHRILKKKVTMRCMFVDKFLVWKVFPVCCLRWILQFSVFECPPNSGSQASSQKTSSYLDVVDRLFSIWSRREFVQSSSMEQQAYVTAAVGLCLERMSTKELEATKDVFKYILQGVSCRLESPIGLVRKMASAVALVFSKVVDPNKPLYLDDDCSDNIDWEFGLTSQKQNVIVRDETREDESKISLPEERYNASHDKKNADMKHNPSVGGKIISENRLSSSKIIDPTMPRNKPVSAEEDDDESKNSDASSDSLEPYDLEDNDLDLKKFSQLGDVAAALRKPDDPDGVEKALDIAEKLVRASPDELPHHSGDLVRALVHVRCSDVTVEGEEDSAEEKRQKALEALLVTCPFESLDVLTRLLYSPNVDVSQRILILDVMTEAAQELSESTVIRRKYQQRNLISSISGHPWFIPSSRGPPGAGPWKEVSDPGTSISWSRRYEREIPSRAGPMKSGKSRKWGLVKAKDPLLETSKNRFPLYAAAFMLPVMQGFDKRRHGVDLLGRDFIVLGKLIYMLGVCMKCVTMHPEASALAPALLDMIRSREVSHHAEAYVRRSVLFAASCILVALHPSHVASALIEGNQDISIGLEWIRTWALQIAQVDQDAECSTMAMTCLQLHAEMALQTSRALESIENLKARTTTQSLKLDKIIIPLANMR
ncbi:telomere length regulation protein [Canna indica]|uniref:Telomere length regulation protein n=1 Tax=Canna indica TaxID=4628 RepID=A0AAQ3KFX5_9LILI|nr:telomere length regulation protein [Canna indica]